MKEWLLMNSPFTLNGITKSWQKAALEVREPGPELNNSCHNPPLISKWTEIRFDPHITTFLGPKIEYE